MFNEKDLINKQYEVRKRLEGGMGYVYLVYDQVSGNQFALKMVKDELQDHETALNRFEDEARAWINLESHPHIVRAISFHRVPAPFLLEEYIDGPNLYELIKSQSCGLSFRQAVEFAIHIARGLDHAHTIQFKNAQESPVRLNSHKPGSQAIGIIHRDLKPHNVLINSRCQAKIADFGLAKIIGENSYATSQHIVGSLPYMAPEQVEARKITKRTDIYSFGVTLYEMITGKRPYPSGNFAEMAKYIKKYAPIPMTNVRHDIPARLSDLVYECLNKKPQQRPNSARELIKRLEALRPTLPEEPVEPCQRCGFVSASPLQTCPVCMPKSDTKEQSKTWWGCHYCSAYLELAYRFCTNCGTPRGKTRCKACAEVNDLTNRFCTQCGSSMNAHA